MSFLEWIAFVSGVAGVYLTVTQKTVSWIVELLAIVITAWIYFEQHLLANTGLQVFYFVLSIYGWFSWRYDKAINHLIVLRLTYLQILLLLLGTAFQAVVYYYALIHFNGNNPLFDAILSAASVTTTFMMARKFIENWIAWIIIDLLYVVFNIQQNLILLAFLSFVFAIMAIFGYYSWKKVGK